LADTSHDPKNNLKPGKISNSIAGYSPGSMMEAIALGSGYIANPTGTAVDAGDKKPT
jgi:hypothetical protein